MRKKVNYFDCLLIRTLGEAEQKKTKDERWDCRLVSNRPKLPFLEALTAWAKDRCKSLKWSSFRFNIWQKGFPALMALLAFGFSVLNVTAFLSQKNVTIVFLIPPAIWGVLAVILWTLKHVRCFDRVLKWLVRCVHSGVKWVLKRLVEYLPLPEWVPRWLDKYRRTPEEIRIPLRESLNKYVPRYLALCWSAGWSAYWLIFLIMLSLAFHGNHTEDYQWSPFTSLETRVRLFKVLSFGAECPSEEDLAWANVREREGRFRIKNLDNTYVQVKKMDPSNLDSVQDDDWVIVAVPENYEFHSSLVGSPLIGQGSLTNTIKYIMDHKVYVKDGANKWPLTELFVSFSKPHGFEKRWYGYYIRIICCALVLRLLLLLLTFLEFWRGKKALIREIEKDPFYTEIVEQWNREDQMGSGPGENIIDIVFDDSAPGRADGESEDPPVKTESEPNVDSSPSLNGEGHEPKPPPSGTTYLSQDTANGGRDETCSGSEEVSLCCGFGVKITDDLISQNCGSNLPVLPDSSAYEGEKRLLKNLENRPVDTIYVFVNFGTPDIDAVVALAKKLFVAKVKRVHIFRMGREKFAGRHGAQSEEKREKMWRDTVFSLKERVEIGDAK